MISLGERAIHIWCYKKWSDLQINQKIMYVYFVKKYVKFKEVKSGKLIYFHLISEISTLVMDAP